MDNNPDPRAVALAANAVKAAAGAGAHPCPLPDCPENNVPNHDIMCRPHFKMVSKELKRELVRSFNAYLDKKSPAARNRHHVAVQECILDVMRQLKPAQEETNG